MCKWELRRWGSLATSSAVWDRAHWVEIHLYSYGVVLRCLNGVAIFCDATTPTFGERSERIGTVFCLFDKLPVFTSFWTATGTGSNPSLCCWILLLRGDGNASSAYSGLLWRFRLWRFKWGTNALPHAHLRDREQIAIGVDLRPNWRSSHFAPWLRVARSGIINVPAL